jgi:competence protein ComEA
MKRIFAFLVAMIAATGLAFAQKAETPKNEMKAPAKAEMKKDSGMAKADAKKDAGMAKADAKKDAAMAKGEPMDINSASEKELATLKGIGDVRAKAIVKGRPYKGKDDLVQKKIIPENVYADIKDQIIAKQDGAMAKKADSKKPEMKKDEMKKKS